MRALLAILSLGGLVACASSAEPPETPPTLTSPPPVATEGFLTAYTEQVVPMTVSELRAFMEERPVIDFLQPTENISNPVEAGVVGAYIAGGLDGFSQAARAHASER